VLGNWFERGGHARPLFYRNTLINTLTQEWGMAYNEGIGIYDPKKRMEFFKSFSKAKNFIVYSPRLTRNEFSRVL